MHVSVSYHAQFKVLWGENIQLFWNSVQNLIFQITFHSPPKTLSNLECPFTCLSYLKAKRMKQFVVLSNISAAENTYFSYSFSICIVFAASNWPVYLTSRPFLIQTEKSFNSFCFLFGNGSFPFVKELFCDSDWLWHSTLSWRCEE